MARLSAAEVLAREIDPRDEAATLRESWTLAEAKEQMGMGYSPESVAGRTGWPVMMLNTSLSHARKTWNAIQEAAHLAEVQEAERLEAERRAAEDAEAEARLVAANAERAARDLEVAEARRVVKLMREHDLTVEDLVRLIEWAAKSEAEPPAEPEPLAEYEGLVEDAVQVPDQESQPPTPAEIAVAPQPEPVQTGVHVSTADTGHELTPLEQFMAATEPPEGKVIELNVKKVRDVSNLAWSGEALSFVEQYGMKEFIEAAARFPTSIDVDPHQADVDYPVERRRRGDMEVSIGFRNEAEPMVLYVHLFTGEVTYRPSSGSPQGKGKGNAGSMSHHYPMTANDLIKKAQDLGFTATYGRDAELRWRDGRVAMRVPRGTADRKEIVRSWNRLQDWLRENTQEGHRAAAAH